MICAISLQSEIFRSWGYHKYVTQSDGSMDLIVQLADLKAKSIAFTFNNLKIRKIISIQRRKETILATVEKLKEKLKRWRLFTRTTLSDYDQRNKEEDQRRKEEEEREQKGAENSQGQEETGGSPKVPGENENEKDKDEKVVKFAPDEQGEDDFDDPARDVGKKNKVKKVSQDQAK